MDENALDKIDVTESAAPKKRLYLWLIVTAVFSVACTVLQTTALFTVYEPNRFAYKNGSLLGVLTPAAIVAAAVAALVLLIFVNRRNKIACANGLYRRDILTVIVSAAAGAALVYAAYTQYTHRTENLLTVTILQLVAAVMTAGYLVLSSVTDSSTGSSLTQSLVKILGLFPPLYFALCMVADFFEIGAVAHDPVRVIFELAVLAEMLFFLFELRIRFYDVKAGTYMAVGFLAVVLGLASSVAYMTACIASSELANIHGNAAFAGFQIIISIYAIVRSLHALGKGADHS